MAKPEPKRDTQGHANAPYAFYAVMEVAGDLLEAAVRLATEPKPTHTAKPKRDK